MDDLTIDAVPVASAAAWSPTAAPAPPQSARVLTLEDAPPAAAGENLEPDPEPVPQAAGPPAAGPDRLGALRDIARRLRGTPDGDDALQFVIDTACACTASDAGVLTVQTPATRQFVAGTALGAGPYISVPLRAGGPSFGEIVLTRMSDAPDYASDDETFAELVAEYIAKAISTLRAGTVVSQDVQDFVDRVTEELRSPLAGAVNTTKAVLAGELPDDARRYLATTRADVTRLLGTVDDLLALAHLRPPELRHMEAIPVGPWLGRALDRFRFEAELRGVKLVLAPAGEALVVQGKADQLDLVIGHLIANALKFSDPGGSVEVGAELVAGLVRVTVADRGIGFDPGEAVRLTECFARGLTAEAAKIPGLGLGLHLANEIVKFHNGRLWLQSARDEGTRAHLELEPRAEPV